MKIPPFITNNASTILSGAAVLGVVTTAVLAVRAVRPAQNMVLEARPDPGDDVSRLDMARLTWKAWLPAAGTGIATIACVIGANQIGLRRNAALVGAYTIADTAFRQYKDEVLDQIGENKERKVRDAVAAKQIDEHPVKDSQVIITGAGDQLCYESLTGRYFQSNIETIRQATNDFNARIISDMYASLNELHDLWGLGETIVGEQLGFNLDNLADLEFSSHLASDGRAALSVGYKNLPSASYLKY
jgi:hypothetical protein